MMRSGWTAPPRRCWASWRAGCWREPVVLLFAARETTEAFADLADLVIEGLDDAEARKLLASVIAGRLDDRVADQLVAETRGNPLALLKLPRGLSPAQLAGGSALTAALSLAATIEQRFLPADFAGSNPNLPAVYLAAPWGRTMTRVTPHASDALQARAR